MPLNPAVSVAPEENEQGGSGLCPEPPEDEEAFECYADRYREVV